MASITPNEGQEWISEKMLGQLGAESAYIIAVGNGTTSPTEDNTVLDNELYRSNDDNSNCTIELTTASGGIVGRITISGGTEVPAGSDITEFGLFASDGSTLLYREVRDAVTIESGDRKTFEFTLGIEN